MDHQCCQSTCSFHPSFSRCITQLSVCVYYVVSVFWCHFSSASVHPGRHSSAAQQ